MISNTRPSEGSPLEVEKIEKILLELNKTGLSYLKYRKHTMNQCSIVKPYNSSRRQRRSYKRS